jgi:HPt (histidine-containing phosphotransfer) domain-containing protein
MENDGNHRQDEKDVNEKSGDVEYEKPSQPQQEQDKSKSEKHSSPLSVRTFYLGARIAGTVARCANDPRKPTQGSRGSPITFSCSWGLCLKQRRAVADIHPRFDVRYEANTMAGTEGTWDVSMTLEQLGGDESLLHEVLDIFLVEAPKHLAALRFAVAQGEAETVETAAHTLKGELGYLGIPEISRRAAELEDMGRSHNLQGAASLLEQFDADVTGLIATIRTSVSK